MLVDLDVWAGDLYAGTLPQLCVLTGEPTPGVHSVRYTTTPRWLGALVLLGILPYVIGYAATRRTVTGAVPMCARGLRRFVVQRAVSLGVVVVVPTLCWVSGALLLNASWPAAGGALIAAGFLLAILGLIGCTLWAGAIGVGGRVEDRPGWGRWVHLQGVNPTFAAAVNHLYAARQPVWQIGTIPPAFEGVPLPRGYAPSPGPFGYRG